MDSMSLYDHDNTLEPKKSYLAISGDGNEDAAKELLEELKDCSVVSHNKSVTTRFDKDNKKKVGFYMTVYFDNGSDAKKAYDKLGGL